jgi:hypothetical protein
MHDLLDLSLQRPWGVARRPEAHRAEAVLSNLSEVAVGVDGCGTDTGRITVGHCPSRSGARHAHPAVRCASTYSRMLPETLDAKGNTACGYP